MKLLKLLSILLVCFLFTSATKHPALVAEWKMEGNANDNGGNGLNGTVNGPTITTGKFGQCYSFSGTSGHNITVEDNDLLSFTSGGGVDKPFSITCWINVLTFTAGREGIVVKRYSSTVNEYSLLINNNLIVFALLNIDISGYIQAYFSYSTTSQWIFLCATYNGSKLATGMKIYKNCVESQTVQSGIGTYVGMSNSTSPVYVGNMYSSGNPFYGLIDEVKIWNKQLNNEDQKRIMSGFMPL